MHPIARLAVAIGRWRILAACASLGLSLAFPSALTAAGTIDFNRDIRRIFSSRCFECHDASAQKSGLRLDQRDTALKGGKSGKPAIVPGKSAESELLARITSSDPDYRMPAKAEPLSETEVTVLKRWIDSGAPWSDERGHWAYRPPVRPAEPAVQNRAWVRNPIDGFVLARLETEKLAPSPEADRYTLIRRLYLDLTGLPPSVEEVDAFVKDATPDAYERTVDRLLASPHYGERQARPWLDAARYADTSGYVRDHLRPMWPWRDWVINAYNRNLPFDQFTIEQLAGDLLPNPTPEQMVATAFHRNTLNNDAGGLEYEEYRTAAMMDRTETTATMWLAATFNCARCHNHKFDPFSQKEYYQLYAFFNQTGEDGRTQLPVMQLTTREQKQAATKLKFEIGELADQLSSNTREMAARQVEWEKKVLTGPPEALRKLPPSVREVLAIPVEKRSAVDTAILAGAYRDQAPELAEVRARMADAQRRQYELTRHTPAILYMSDHPGVRETRILERGDFHSPGEPVSANVPAVLPPLPAGTNYNRLALARWLVSTNHPLTARVTMNRLWEQYFGRGIVESVEDFGLQGELPTHPELLDWLATEFMRTGWNLKAMHKLIVCSATYRQSSRVTSEGLQRDPENELLGRGPRFRVEAEMVRDIALAASGRLNPEVGGPSVYPPQPQGVWEAAVSFTVTNDRWMEDKGPERYRRALYTFWRRSAPFPAALIFDTEIRDGCSVRRHRTNTPLQALNLMNDPLFIESAGGLAQRMMAVNSAGSADKARQGFRLCVARPPEPAELTRLVQLFETSRDRFQREPDSIAEFLAQAHVSATGTAGAELAAWTTVANVLLSLDETITKN